MKENQRLIEQTAAVVKANPRDLVQKVCALADELKASAKTIEKLEAKIASSKTDDILKSGKDIDGVMLYTQKLDGADAAALRTMGDSIKDKLDCGVCVLASAADGKIVFAAVASKKALDKGIHAGKLVGAVAKIAGGGGGGKPDSAQAGGKDISKLDEALCAAADIVKEQIKQ